MHKYADAALNIIKGKTSLEDAKLEKTPVSISGGVVKPLWRVFTGELTTQGKSVSAGVAEAIILWLKAHWPAAR